MIKIKPINTLKLQNSYAAYDMLDYTYESTLMTMTQQFLIGLPNLSILNLDGQSVKFQATVGSDSRGAVRQC